MDIGIAIFASVVLLLIVFHKTFRKAAFWAAGITTVVSGIFLGISYLNTLHYERKQQAEHEVAVKACVARFPRADAFDVVVCGENTSAQPEVVEPDSAKVTCGLLVDLHPDWYLVDGFGHCTLKPKTPKKSKPKTGTVTSEIYLFVDTCDHLSSKKVPAGSKVKILGRADSQPPCFGGDLVKVSIDGVTGWVEAPYVVEDVADQSGKEAPTR